MRALRTLSTMIGLAAVVAATAAAPPIASAEPAAGAQLVAIGDSFMAAGSNAAAITGPVGTACNQATDNVAHLVASSFPQMTFADYSCVGALTTDVYAPSTRGPQNVGLSPATKVAIVSIGGNDAGFEQIATDCLFALSCPPEKKAQFSANVASVGPKLTGAYAAIRQAAPNARVFTVGYLPILPPDAKGCLVGLINTQETINFLNGLQRQLNDTIVAESSKAGFTPVIPATSSDHSVCAADFQRYVSMTGAGAGDEGIPMHPTAPGRQYVAERVAIAMRSAGVQGT
ncbi:putative secreted hydrolase [Mycobacteroides abscessus 5S-0422]|uniref:SGNH/GDSL hydrolase family protein n=1 Tax=Mycobacteroides abscessus TaxID=36809 RepID=UPI0002682DC6|nr:SGNH/GDSL hydrolase family protein [Mycobacteroides abscessus]EIU03763.1 putative secreted hydrolase [Mycobacteroides abscessus 5S-0422]EIU07354.1 putative secreted hydrolase [Mycobacteroides abscessus 5S-0421]EIU10294.1 putative secreted hydrolase [Mycobacteroides abscessus 5S-0304]EIU22454.1 putative secreted hydrolase [Mycobacteroides abscessus 5S-0708]EIU25688.1 putative secreted hydrolase [Mycobacteroides abscessus 5S-0817]